MLGTVNTGLLPFTPPPKQYGMVLESYDVGSDPSLSLTSHVMLDKSHSYPF